jgi:uncharacterized membrane protein (UPF0127 family)
VNRKYFLALFVLLVALAALFFVTTSRDGRISIGDTRIAVEIVDTPEARARGLSGRDALSANSGMLFVFEEPTFASIWMKDMKFPIDIVWISAEGVIVDIKKGVTPASYPEIFIPREKSLYVLELPQNFSDQHGIFVGSKVDW